MKFLVVEDNARVSAALRAALNDQGLEAVCADTGKAAIELLDTNPDAVLLDVDLPDCDGFTLCSAMRASSSVPILVTTARSDHASRVRGLDLGADDYLVKPYNLAELLARVRAVMRRRRPTAGGAAADAAPGDLILAGPVRIDLWERVVMINGFPVDLSDEEFSILAALARRPGETLDFEQLAEEILRTKRMTLQESIHRYIASLRQRLGDPHQLEAVEGSGYRLTLAGTA
ncbi:response regulator transcription factor [Streptomyces sp. NPDC057638]|uniref:response regulator transcription factor n=1 Tax=Streptomyces sp. NPDC057638 TaxID=3346190 RepID=UPI0036958304